MNRIQIVLFLLLLYSCKEDRKKDLHNRQKEELASEIETSKDSEEIDIDRFLEAKDTLVEMDLLTDEIKFNIDYIKSKTSSLSIDISVEYEPDNKQDIIPKEFVFKYLTPHKINIGYPDHLPPDYPEAYAFKEFKEFPEFLLFTFTYDDESCCTTLYAVTTKKDTLEVVNIGVIGYTGGDGGWVGEKYGKWLNDTILKTIVVSDYDDDLVENNNSEIDTTWTVIKLDKNGYFEENEIDSVKYIGNRRIE